MSRSHAVRVLVVTQYYHPEVGAPQTRLRETVAGLRARGFKVTVVAPVPSYPLGVVPRGYAWWRPTRERVDGTPVVRMPTLAVPGAAMSHRIVGHASFALTSLACLGIGARHDVALVESPPLFLALTARVLRAIGTPYVFHVADPWPDFPIAMGYLRSSLERRLAFALEDFAYRRASAITTVSPGLVTLLSRKRSATGRVTLVPNGVETGRFVIDDSQSAARRRLGWEDAFTVVYAGTVGLAQGIGTLLEAARLLHDDVRIRIVGEGVEKQQLEANARASGLANVTFHPAVTRDGVPMILAAADAGLVILRQGPLFEESLPTKLLETMAAGRPVIAGADGHVARIVRQSGGGYVACAEDPADLARAIEACRRDPGRELRGAAGRAFAVRHHDRDVVLDRLATILIAAARSS